MHANVTVHQLATEEHWQAFSVGLAVSDGGLLSALFCRLRDAGASSAIHEHAYIDRDFSAAYSSFYSTLFRPYLKYCSRLHFFGKDMTPLISLEGGASAIAAYIEATDADYRGYVVLRPLTHAPVSTAVISAAGTVAGQEIMVRAVYEAHLLGANLAVEAMPLTQQDTRTGACAQAAIWMVGRHFHTRHSAPWFSLPDITEVALKPTDSGITRSLPAGSEYLTPDNMVRALRAMGQHPVVYAPNDVNGVATWGRPSPREIISRYIDSGMPVILGMQDAASQIGHGVVVVGAERTAHTDTYEFPVRPTMAEFTTHFLVNDDQRGVYRRLPVAIADKTGEYPFCLDTDVKFIMVPLPSKVYMTAEIAEVISRDAVRTASIQRAALVAEALSPEDAAQWNPDSEFYLAVAAETLVTRTYLTFGWKYKSRAIRNGISERLKSELLLTQFPRYVWITEYSFRAEVTDLDSCKRLIRGHVVVDATGSRFWDSALIVDLPGLSLLWRFDPSNPAAGQRLVISAELDSAPYWPKIRGEEDYSSCAIDPIQTLSA